VVVARSDVLTAQFKTLVADLSIAIDRAKPHKPHADKRRPHPKRGAPSQA
jgi:ribonuclease P protein component